MDARMTRWVIPAVMIALINITTIEGASYRTPNFVVTAPTRDFAVKVGRAAEYYRKELAVAWLGKELPKWYRPCPIAVRVGPYGAGGATSFQFDRGEVFGWKMNVQGSEERIIDSVIPHEVSHTIFASYFRRPLPRWADEGAATLIEHDSERLRQSRFLEEARQYGKCYTLRELLAIKEYPSSHSRVLTLYAQGYSLADYLVQKQGKATFLKFLTTSHQYGWDQALQHHYKLKNIEQLEEKWDSWVMAGSPRLNLPEGEMVAEAENDSAESLVRGQSPEEDSGVVLGESDEVPSDAPEAALDAPAEKPERTRESVVQNEESAHEPAQPDTAVAEEAGPKPAATTLSDFQLRGRQNVITAGWEPVAAGRESSVTASARPPFVEETALSLPARPPFVEKRHPRERPPFVD